MKPEDHPDKTYSELEAEGALEENNITTDSDDDVLANRRAMDILGASIVIEELFMRDELTLQEVMELYKALERLERDWETPL